MDRREFGELTGAAVAGLLVAAPGAAQPTALPDAVVRPRQAALADVKRLASLSAEQKASGTFDARERGYLALLKLFETKTQRPTSAPRRRKRHSVR